MLQINDAGVLSFASARCTGLCQKSVTEGLEPFLTAVKTPRKWSMMTDVSLWGSPNRGCWTFGQHPASILSMSGIWSPGFFLMCFFMFITTHVTGMLWPICVKCTQNVHKHNPNCTRYMSGNQNYIHLYLSLFWSRSKANPYRFFNKTASVTRGFEEYRRVRPTPTIVFSTKAKKNWSGCNPPNLTNSTMVIQSHQPLGGPPSLGTGKVFGGHCFCRGHGCWWTLWIISLGFQQPFVTTSV